MFVVAVENDKKVLNKPAVAPHATKAWSGSERAPRLRIYKAAALRQLALVAGRTARRRGHISP